MYSQPKIDIREVVNLLGLKVDPRCSINSDSFNVQCPFCRDKKYHMNINAEKNVDDGTSRWLEYVQIEKGLAVQAQTAMNTWYQLQHQRTSLQASRDLLAVSLAAVRASRPRAWPLTATC